MCVNTLSNALAFELALNISGTFTIHTLFTTVYSEGIVPFGKISLLSMNKFIEPFRC